jgi:hypothetical protein
MSLKMDRMWKMALAAGMLAAWTGAEELKGTGTTTTPAAAMDSAAARPLTHAEMVQAQSNATMEARRDSEGRRIQERVERLRVQAEAAAKAREEKKEAPSEARVFISNEKSPSETVGTGP